MTAKLSAGPYAEQMFGSGPLHGHCDIFEALTPRPALQKSKTLTESLTILGKLKLGGHVDPDLFDVFMWDKIYEKYAKQFLDPEQIDSVDLAKFPDISRRGTWN